MVVWNKLKKIKIALKDLNNYMAAYSYKLTQARQQLETVQAHITTQLYDQSCLIKKKIY